MPPRTTRQLARRRAAWAWFAAALVFAVGFWILDGVISLLSHLPPRPFDFDPVILALFRVEGVLQAPRGWLRALWPGETTPQFLNGLTSLLNALLWGLGWRLLRRLQQGPAPSAH